MFLEVFFWKILFVAYSCFIFVQIFQWTSELFFDIRFSSRRSQSQQKLAKKISHFTIKFRSKNLTHFTNLNSLDVENNMLPQHSQKPFWLKIFPANMFLFGVRKNICTTPFLDVVQFIFGVTVFFKLFESKCLHISVYLRKRYFVPAT